MTILDRPRVSTYSAPDRTERRVRQALYEIGFNPDNSGHLTRWAREQEYQSEEATLNTGILVSERGFIVGYTETFGPTWMLTDTEPLNRNLGAINPADMEQVVSALRADIGVDVGHVFARDLVR